MPQEGVKIRDLNFEIPKNGIYEVRIVAWLLAQELPGEFDSVAKRTRLILATHGGRPVLPSSDLAQGGKVAVGHKAREVQSWIEIGGSKVATKILTTKGILPRGLTLEFKVWEKIEQDGVEARGDRAGPTLSFCISRDSEDKLTVSILREEPQATKHGLHGIVDQELIVLDRAPLPGKEPLFLVWPANLAHFKEQWVAVYFEIKPKVERGLGKALVECEDSLLRRSKEAQARASAVSPEETHAIDLVHALESLALIPKRRAMLVNQSEKTGASLALDLGLAAEDSFLAAYILRLIPLLKDKKREDLVPEKLGWILEREAWAEVLLRLEADPFPPQSLALAVRHAGQLARYPGMLHALLERAASIEDLHTAILMENRAILVSNMPGARFRAYLWLESRGDDLGDYKPMATQTERRQSYHSLVKKWESGAQQK